MMDAALETTVETSIDDRGVATVSLNCPERHNAFDDAMIKELTRIFTQLTNNKNVRLVILTASGKSFCSGADLNWMRRMASYDYEENIRDASALAKMLYTLNTLSQPTIARVQGAAFGGGVGLVSCCDIAIASQRASFSLSEVKLGLLPATISPYVIEAIGSRAARRYFTTAERFTAETALRIGLISECVDDSNLDNRIHSIIESLLANGPQAVIKAKEMVFDIRHCPIDQSLLEHTSELIANVRSSSEAKEGLAAFLGKRAPNWSNHTESE